MKKNNIVLIGMPSSGKSSIGVFLAEKLKLSFVDTDLLIKNAENKDLKEIVNTQGLNKFLEIQEREILSIKAENHVIATGGGVIYGNASMEFLKQCGIIVYLKLEYNEIEKRVTPDRRFARADGQSLKDIYNERVPKYEKYADISIDCKDKSVEQVADLIIKEVINTGVWGEKL